MRSELPVLTKKGKKAKQALASGADPNTSFEKFKRAGIDTTDVPITSSQMGFLWAALNGRYDHAKIALQAVDNYLSFKTTPSDRRAWLKKCLTTWVKDPQPIFLATRLEY